MDLQINGSSKFSVRYDGVVNVSNEVRNGNMTQTTTGLRYGSLVGTMQLGGVSGSGAAGSNSTGAEIDLANISAVSNPGGIVFRTGVASVNNQAEVMRIDSNGNVGIGTTTPNTKLFLQNAAGTTDIFRIASSSNALLDAFDFQGHLGIGTTTDTSNLAIQGTSGQTTNLFTISSSSGVSLLTVASAADTSFSVMASSTAGSNDYYFKANKVGISASSTSPTLSSCGTSPSVVGSNPAMVVTVGSVAATACTITFKPPFTNSPSCTISNRSMSVVNAMTYTVSNTAMTVSQTALTGDVLDIHCFGIGE
jgi:hypothetical protein